MDEIMNFLEANYIWLIVIGVVLVMALIGYIAEKNNYGKIEKKPKESKEKKDKKSKEKKEEVKEQITTPEIDFNNFDVELESTPVTEPIPSEEPEKKEEEGGVQEVMPTFEDLNIPTKEPEPMNEDLTVPLEGTKKEEVPVLEEIPADLYAPIGDVVEEKTADPISAPDVKPVDAALPDLDKIKETETTTSDDDVWKF